MGVEIRHLSTDDRKTVIDIFNHYVETGFAAYPDTKLPYEAFDLFLRMAEGYPAVTAWEGGRMTGFGMLRAYSPIATFSRTSEISYFLKSGCTGRGIGKAILGHLLTKGREQGIVSVLASISSLNEGSINFHLKNGFLECGRFREAGLKMGRIFDVIYMQKFL